MEVDFKVKQKAEEEIVIGRNAEEVEPKVARARTILRRVMREKLKLAP